MISNMLTFIYNNMFLNKPIVFILILLTISTYFKEKNLIRLKKMKKDAEKHKENVLLIKAKHKDKHPERVNYYLNEYYEKVNFNPINTLIKYIAAEVLSSMVFFMAINPSMYISNINKKQFDFFFIKNVFYNQFDDIPILSLNLLTKTAILFILTNAIIHTIFFILEKKYIEYETNINLKNILSTLLFSIVAYLILHLILKPAKIYYIYSIALTILTFIFKKINNNVSKG